MAKDESICKGLGTSRFTILEKDWYTMQAWAKIAYDEDKNEISGLLCVVEIEPNKYILANPEILKQENTGTTTTLDNTEVSKYMTKWAAKYDNKKIKIKGKTYDILSQVRYCWWHSHHTMDAFWSGTDTNEIEAWANKSWTSSLVINLKEEYQFRVCVWEPLVAHHDAELNIFRGDRVKVTDDMVKQYKELCSEKTPVYNIAKNSYGGYGRYNGYGHLKQQTTFLEQPQMSSEQAMVLATIENVGTQFLTTEVTFEEYLEEMGDIKDAIKEDKLPFNLEIHKDEQSAIEFWTFGSADKLLTFKKGGKA